MSVESIERNRADKGPNERELQELMREPTNTLCADCGNRGPRWASYNLGVFLCIRCGGLHRRLGTHISKVRSLTLDTWTSEQIQSLKQWGNQRANAHYNPQPELFFLPTSDSEMEQFIRDKYERKSLMQGAASNSHFRVQQTGGASQRAGTQQAVATNQPQPASFAGHLAKLKEMGFTDEKLCQQSLTKFNGDLVMAIDWLSSQPASRPVTTVTTPFKQPVPQQQQPDLALFTTSASAPPPTTTTATAFDLLADLSVVPTTTATNTTAGAALFSVGLSSAPVSDGSALAQFQSQTIDFNMPTTAAADAKPTKPAKENIMALFGQPQQQSNFNQNLNQSFNQQQPNPFAQQNFGQQNPFGQQAQFGQQQAQFGQQQQQQFGRQQSLPQFAFGQQPQQFGQTTGSYQAVAPQWPQQQQQQQQFNNFGGLQQQQQPRAMSQLAGFTGQQAQQPNWQQPQQQQQQINRNPFAAQPQPMGGSLL